MTVSTANTSITLDAHSPKKDAVTETLGSPVVGDTAVAVRSATNINTNLVQSIVGTYSVLLRYALNNLQSLAATGPTTLSAPLGGTIANVAEDAILTGDDVVLYIGADLITKQQSHFIDRTVKRLIEAWLEA